MSTISAASGAAGRLLGAGLRGRQIDRGVDGAAACVPHHQDELAPTTAQPYSMLPRIFGLATLPATRTLKISPRPRSKMISAGVRIDAAQHDGERMLPLGGAVELAFQVARQRLPLAKAFVAFLQKLQHLRGRQLLLQVARRVIDILNVVIELILVAKAAQADLDAVRGGNLFLEVANQIEHIRVDVVRVGGVEQHHARRAAPRRIFSRAARFKKLT